MQKHVFKKAIAVLGLAIPLLASAGPKDHYWIELTDKGRWETVPAAALVDSAKVYGLKDAALERRRVEGIVEAELVTVADLPNDETYCYEVETFGAEIRCESRWFNRLSVEADVEAMALIEELPFVKRVFSVRKMVPAAFSYEVVSTFDGNPAPGPGVDMPGLYGPSYLQALQVNAVEAHRLGYVGRGVLLAVIDGGFELSHECFAHLDVVAEWDVLNNDDETGHEPQDADWQAGHGTACLSEIVGYSPGNLIGIAYGASVILGKTEDVAHEGPFEEDNYSAAIEWFERNGARVTSGSLGYTDWYNSAMMDGVTSVASQALNRARELGVVCCTSAGNAGPQPRTVGAPGDSWGALAIGAIDSLHSIGRFSSRGPTSDNRIKPDLVARGVKTVLSEPYSERQYSIWNGTSMSTPVIGGVVTLVRGAHPEWSATQTIRALKATADRADRPDNVYGWGTPDVMAAIRYPEICVQVVDDVGNPLKTMVTVTSEGGVVVNVATDEAGVASFPNLSDGTYRWEVGAKPGMRLLEGAMNGEHVVGNGLSMNVVLTQ